jgi:hypothetical protein
VNYPISESLNSPIHSAVYLKDPISIALLVNAGASIEKKV